jgi:hypothetical protein
MREWVVAEWPNIRPNLEASVIWVPVSLAGSFAWHEWRLRRHLRRIHDRLDARGVPRG